MKNSDLSEVSETDESSDTEEKKVRLNFKIEDVLKNHV